MHTLSPEIHPHQKESAVSLSVDTPQTKDRTIPKILIFLISYLSAYIFQFYLFPFFNGSDALLNLIAYFLAGTIACIWMSIAFIFKKRKKALLEKSSVGTIPSIKWLLTSYIGTLAFWFLFLKISEICCQEMGCGIPMATILFTLLPLMAETWLLTACIYSLFERKITRPLLLALGTFLGFYTIIETLDLILDLM